MSTTGGGDETVDDRADAVFPDRTVCTPDLVVCATGYRPGLERFAGHLVTLDRDPYGNPSALRRRARRLAAEVAEASDGDGR